MPIVRDDFWPWLYDTIHSTLSQPDSSSGVRVGRLTYQQTALYDAIVERVGALARAREVDTPSVLDALDTLAARAALAGDSRGVLAARAARAVLLSMRPDGPSADPALLRRGG